MKKYILIFFLQFLFVSICFAQYGAGVYIEGAGKLTNCIIANNSGQGTINFYGGGVAITGDGALVSNCLILSNLGDYASAIFCNGNATVTNSTIVNNQVTRQAYPDPFIIVTNGTLTLTNNLVWGNKNQSTSDLSPMSGNITATYCAFEGDTPYQGVGNIALSATNTDPTGPDFLDVDFGPRYAPLLGNTRLAANSILRGKGNTILLPAGLTTDMDGKPRKYGDFMDMGCYQSYSSIWLSGKTVTYTGLPQGVDAPQFFDSNANPVSQPGSTTATYTYYQNGTSLGTGVIPTNAGTYEAVAAFPGGGGLPAGTSNRVTLIINKAMLTVTAKNRTTVYGVLPTASELADWYDISGFVNGETESVLTTKPTVTLSPDITASTPPGSYPGKILISGGAANNYEFTYNYGTLIIQSLAAEIKQQPTGTSICLGGNHTLRVEATGDNLSYQWYKGNNTVPGANSNTLRIENATKNDYDTYYVKVSNSANTVVSDRVRLWIADQLPSILSFASYPSPAIKGQTYLLKLNGYMDVSKYSWSYSKPGITFQKTETTGNETTVTFSSEAIGKGTISVEMEHVCGNRIATQEIEVRYPTGIDNIAGSSMKVYPNPAKEQLTIENDHSLISKVVVMDMSGKILHQAQPNVLSYQLSVANYPKGIYFVKIATESGETVKKIVKN